MKNNIDLLKKLSWVNDVELKITLDYQLSESIDIVRGAISKTTIYNSIKYPAVYLDQNTYGVLACYSNNIKVQAIMNLEYYYVYGFGYDDGTVYAFSGEGEKNLKALGFETLKIPYACDYFSIMHNSLINELQDLTEVRVNADNLRNACASLSQSDIVFSEKSNDVLTFLWSIIEGIRFGMVSDEILKTIKGGDSNMNYSRFLDIARNWSNLSTYCAKAAIRINQIAVYDLNRIQRAPRAHLHTREEAI